MPLPLIKSYAKKANVPESRVEELWAAAKEKAKGIRRSSVIDASYWKLVNGIVKRELGLSESITFMEYRLFESNWQMFYCKMEDSPRYEGIELPIKDLSEISRVSPELWKKIYEYHDVKVGDNDIKNITDERIKSHSREPDVVKFHYSFMINFTKQTGWGKQRKVSGDLTIRSEIS